MRDGAANKMIVFPVNIAAVNLVKSASAVAHKNTYVSRREHFIHMRWPALQPAESTNNNNRGSDTRSSLAERDAPEQIKRAKTINAWRT